jgi:hypothetical protein
MKTRALAVGLTALLLTGVAVNAGGLKEAAGETKVTTYYVGDLIVAHGFDGKPLPEAKVDMAPVIKLITTTTARGTWKKDEADAEDAVGSIRPFYLSYSVIVRQTAEGHKEVQNLFRGLRSLPVFQVPVQIVR